MDKDMIGMHKELLLPHRLPHVLQKHGAHKGPKILHNQLNLKQLPLNHIIKAIRLIIVGENLISKVETQVGDQRNYKGADQALGGDLLDGLLEETLEHQGVVCAVLLDQQLQHAPDVHLGQCRDKEDLFVGGVLLLALLGMRLLVHVLGVYSLDSDLALII